MQCSICGGLVIWKGALANLTHTECQQCGAMNSQIAEEPDFDAEPETGYCECQNQTTEDEDASGCGQGECLGPAPETIRQRQAIAQSGEWVMVPCEPTQYMIHAVCKIKLARLEALRDGRVGNPEGVASAVRQEWAALLAAAPQPQAQAQSDEWVQKAIVDAKGDIEYVHVRIFNAMKARAEEAEAMLATAPQLHPAELVAWRTFDGEGGYDYRSYEDNETYRDDYIKRNGLKYSNWVQPLYLHPQPLDQDAKDAARYRWLRDSADSYTWDYLGGIGAGRVDATVDAAMAKESGNG